MTETSSTPAEWVGRDGTHSGKRVLWAEGLDGRPVLAVATGAVVPETWKGRKVRITVELVVE